MTHKKIKCMEGIFKSGHFKSFLPYLVLKLIIFVVVYLFNIERCSLDKYILKLLCQILLDF